MVRDALLRAGFSVHAIGEDVLLAGGRSGSFVLIVRRGREVTGEQLAFMSGFRGPSRIIAVDGDPIEAIAQPP